MHSMLHGHHIVYAANDWRPDNRTSSHHIASYLSASNELLYLEAAGQRTPRISGRDFRRIASRLRKAVRTPVEVQPNIRVASPLIVPFHRYAAVQRFNQWLLNRYVKDVCRNLAFHHPIIWLTIPHYAAILDAVPAEAVVYYCTDDFASFPNTDRDAIRGMEQKILSRADVVFAVSEPLVQDKIRTNPNTFLSPHGVDTAHFSRAMDPQTSVPGDIAGIRRPIAGFFGLVEEWFDLELLDHCASIHTDISFVLIGRTAQDVRPLARRTNVHFLGPRPYELIPDYLRAFDVGLIPFKMTDTVLYSNPLKFKEYLAGGKPVVSVRIEAFEKYRDLAYLAGSYEEFAAAVRRSIDEDSQEKAIARASAMVPESWPAKIEAVCARVNERLAGARPPAL